MEGGGKETSPHQGNTPGNSLVAHTHGTWRRAVVRGSVGCHKCHTHAPPGSRMDSQALCLLCLEAKRFSIHGGEAAHVHATRHGRHFHDTCTTRARLYKDASLISWCIWQKWRPEPFLRYYDSCTTLVRRFRAASAEAEAIRVGGP